MARRISFAQFRQMLSEQIEEFEHRDLGDPEQAKAELQTLGEYLEFDRRSPRPRLIFRADALIDPPPSDYDVDIDIYRLSLAVDGARERGTRGKDLRVVFEGDSWCRLPWILPNIPSAIGDWIGRHNLYNFKNLGHWGDTLDGMMAERQYIAELDAQPANYFLLSAGGNDLDDMLAAGSLLYPFDPNRPVDDYLTQAGKACLERIHTGYSTLLSELRNRYPELKVLCYGYDTPRPLLGERKYIGRYLVDLKIPDSIADAIVLSVFKRLGDLIKDAAQTQGARYVDCQGATKAFTWWNDMHPWTDGFEALAKKFEDAIKNWP